MLVIVGGLDGSQSAPPHRVPQTTFSAEAVVPHWLHVPPPVSQFAVGQITPHSTVCPDAVFHAPHATVVDHALASVASRPPEYRRVPQISCPLQSADAGYVLVDGAAKKRASSTAPFEFRKPAPSVNRS
jgi:hypothetical protein